VHQGDIQAGIDGFFYAEHDVEDDVEWLVARVHQVVLSDWGLWPLNFRAIIKFDGAVCVGGFQDVSILKFIYRDGRLLFC